MSTGSFVHLSDLETILLMKLGPACVAAFNAFTMCADLPAGLLPRHGRAPLRGREIGELMAYAASVGSARAKRKVGPRASSACHRGDAHYSARSTASAPCRTR